jgi:hypothetical protein
MTITPSITSIIDSLEHANDPDVAYFSFTTDESGEHGAIRANKEGLRRYALELLKKSMELEEKHDGKKLCFPPYEWLISDAGYDLIRSVRPEYKSRSEILSDNLRAHLMPRREEPNTSALSNRLLVIMILTLCTIAAAILFFT